METIIHYTRMLLWYNRMYYRIVQEHMEKVLQNNKNVQKQPMNNKNEIKTQNKQKQTQEIIKIETKKVNNV